ncbi:hypothetical protein CARUB_v100033311mg, partial [Capsella rubella]
MKSICRSFNLYPRHHILLFGLCSPAAKKMMSSSSSHSPKQFTIFQNWSTGKDALSLQRNLVCKNRDQLPTRRRRQSLRLVEGEVIGTTLEHKGSNGSRTSMVALDSTNTCTDPTKTSQSQVWKSPKDRNHRVSACNKISPKRRHDSLFHICSSVLKRNDSSTTPCVLVEQAIREAHALIVRESGAEDAERILPVMSPDICIVNFYSETGRLGLHQSFSYGERRDVEEAEGVILESGDVLIFGGESRMILHGVKSIIPNSAPMSLLYESKLRAGRLNLTSNHT